MVQSCDGWIMPRFVDDALDMLYVRGDIVSSAIAT